MRRRWPFPPSPFMADYTQSLFWRNLYLRTTLWYALCAAATWALHHYAPPSWGALGSETLGDLVGDAPALTGGAQPSTPTALAASIAMFTAFAASLPVARIDTLTRRKKGFQRSVVQTYLILPVVAAGIVVLVKHSLALACSLGGIVAAVAPSVAWVISVGFNHLLLLPWWTDFGKPMALEGKSAEQKLERALSMANRTGTFVAKMDDEVLKSMSPAQLEASADRAWRRRKRNDPDLAEEDAVPGQAPRDERMVRLRTEDVEQARTLCEPLFPALCSEWKFLGSVRENDIRVLSTVSPSAPP